LNKKLLIVLVIAVVAAEIPLANQNARIKLMEKQS